MMKLKKSSDSSRREKKVSKSQSILLQAAEEDSRGLLSKENPALDKSVVNAKSNNKRGNKTWGARLVGFGRSSNNGNRNSSGHNHNSNNVSNHEDQHNTNTKKKNKSKKQLGYTQTLKTPKGMKEKEAAAERAQSNPRASSRSSSRTRPRDSSQSHMQSHHHHHHPHAFTTTTTQSTNNNNHNSVHLKIHASSKKHSTSKSVMKLASPQKDSEKHWTPNPFLVHDGNTTTAATSDFSAHFPISPKEQQLFSDEGIPAITMESGSDIAGGFEVTYDKEADSSRLTATTVASVPTAATAAETISTMASSSTKSSPTGSSVASSSVHSPLHHLHKSPMSAVSSTISARSSNISSGTGNNNLRSPISVKSLLSVKSRGSLRSKSSSLSYTKSPTSQVSSLASSNRHSPVAHAAAQALVALSDEPGQDDDEEGDDEDYGENDFDPNEDDGDNESSLEEETSHQSSAFQFNLAASNLQTASHGAASPTSSEIDGFRIVQSKSSMSIGTPKPVRKTTDNNNNKTTGSSSNVSVLSNTSSSLFPSSSAASSQNNNNNTPSPNKKSAAHSPTSAKRQQSKLILARPFGRASLPQMPWQVQISPAEWDNPERRWKYRIQVSRQNSSAMAVTWRSMENFVWLEDALRAEFQGALILPLLSIAVGMTDLEQATHEVDATLLRDWLYDVLNGIRGQGELILGHRSVDLLRSEAVEAFLYRNTAPLHRPGNLIASMMGEAFVAKQEQFKEQQKHGIQQRADDDDEEEERNCQEAMCKPSPRARPGSSPSTIHSPKAPQSFVSSFWTQGPFALITDELCTGMGCQDVEDSPSSTASRFTCSSQALGTADTLDVQDSFLDASTIASMRSSEAGERRQLAKHTSPVNKGPGTWKFAQSTPLIEAERDLVLSYRKTALSTMEKVQVLVEEEENVGLAWKRFGIAVSNLFSYEKEVENARLGERRSHHGDVMPYRKVKKLTVDQCVKALIQQKIDRSVPALRVLRSMLTAYVADLSAVSPSVEAYLEGMAQIAAFDEYFSFQGKQPHRRGKALKNGSSTDSTSSQTSSDEDDKGNNLFRSWSQHLRSFTAPSKEEGLKEDQDIVRTSSSSSQTSTEDHDLPAPATEVHKKRLVEDRVMSNERLLRESLTTLCKSTTIRSARMAYTYFKVEAAQCSLLRSAAASLRSKIDLSNKEALSEMINRHQEENKEDMKTELALAQRIVNLGSMKKYPLSPKGEDADREEKEHAMSVMRDNALQVARERVGRWNSELAMSIMKAVGVNDPNVRVEETTRELRLVRKYAIGLRENLNRCIEAVDLLRQAVLKGGRQDVKGVSVDKRKKSGKHIGETRKEYFAEVAKLFSGVVVESESASPKNSLAPPSPKSLSKAGIKLNDPLGWSTPFVELSSSVIKDKTGSQETDCGSVAQRYIQGRDSQTEWLLSSISGLLNEYTQRVEVVESFVYMECVGVQLEKHFNKRRTEALTAFEKKTDVTTAINIATRKRIPKLVEELKAKLEKFGPDVTHTSVKETKEAHLESKAVKTELHELALRRLLRARETSTERVIDLLKFWMKEEESACISELNALRDIMDALETSLVSASLIRVPP